MHRLHLLGRIDLGDAQSDDAHRVLAQPKRLALLAYLCFASPPSGRRRDDLLAMFWAEYDQEHARKALNKAVHFLRQQLGDETIVSRTAEEIAVDRSLFSCDAVEFIRAFEEGRHRDALALYTGELLPAFFVEDAPGFEEWLELERSRLHGMAAESARVVAGECETIGDLAGALAFSKRTFELAGDDEPTLRGYLELLDRMGDRAGALRVYDAFAARVQELYESQPSVETHALIERIRQRDERLVAPGQSRAAAAQAPAPFTSTVVDAPVGGRTRHRWWAVVVAAGVLLVLLDSRRGGLIHSLVPTADSPRWVLLADFDGPPDDSTVAVTVRDLVMSQLDQSRVLTSVPADQLAAARHAALLPDSARLTVDRARHLAYRTAVGIVIHGRIARIAGGNYSVVLRAVNADDGGAMSSADSTASVSTIIPVVRALARHIASDVAGTSGASRAGSLPSEGATPSFAAYRLYVEGKRRADRGDFSGAVVALHQCVSLDSTFAAAWALLAENQRQLNLPDSARVAYAAAWRYARRLTPFEQFTLEGSQARFRDANATALRAYDDALRENPAWAFGWILRGLSLRVLGRYDEAIASMRHALALYPLGAPESLVFELADQLLSLGQLDEARSLFSTLHDEELRTEAAWRIAEEETDWPLLERLLAPLPPKARPGPVLRFAAALTAQGRWSDARRVYEEHSLPGDLARARIEFEINQVRVASGGSPVWSRAQLGSLVRFFGPSRTPISLRALEYAWTGELDSAQAELQRLRVTATADSTPPESAASVMISETDALIAWQQGRWRDAIQVLSPTAFQGRGGDLMLQRWVVGDAYEHLARLDSAAAYFEWIVRPVRAWSGIERDRGLFYPFALRRLALLYDRMGRAKQARANATRFLQTFANADPEFQPLITEVRKIAAR